MGSHPVLLAVQGKYAALRNQKHMPFKEQERNTITSLPPLFRTQGNTETQAPFGDHLPPDSYCCVDSSDTLCHRLHYTSYMGSVLLSPVTSAKKNQQTNPKNPNYLPWIPATHWKTHLMRSHQLVFWVLSAEVWRKLQPSSRCCKQFHYFAAFNLHSLYHTAVILLTTRASGQYRQLEHKPTCFKPNLGVFLCTTIPISSGTKLPEEQEGCSRVSGA